MLSCCIAALISIVVLCLRLLGICGVSDLILLLRIAIDTEYVVVVYTLFALELHTTITVDFFSSLLWLTGGGEWL
jgi:hypothetical protein